MTFDAYLEQFIEGYLLEDLNSMAPISLAEGKRYGAVGYPMVMTVLSGVEVLGVLTSRAKFNSENGADRFGEYWRNYLYTDRPAVQRLDSLMYEFVRHGLAHSFMTMPMIRVTKYRDPGHLHRSPTSNVICVDALTLAEEFAQAYWRRLRPTIAGEFKINMETRFKEMREAHWQERQGKMHKVAKVPVRTVAFENALLPPPKINSPSVPPLYSTNVSTTGFDDPNK